MSGVFGGSAPSIDVPDPQEIIQAQADARIDSFNPYGSLTFAGENRREGTLNLTPEMQNLVDAILDSAGSEGDFVGSLQDRTLGRLNQDFGLQERRLRDDLVQSGNPVGANMSEGSFNELSLLNRARSDANIDALLQAELMGQNLATSRLGQLGQIGQLAMTGATPATPIDVTGAFQLNQNAQLGNAQMALGQQQGKNQLIGDLSSAAAIGFGG